MNMSKMSISDLKKESSKIVYVTVLAIFVILAIVTGELYWLIIPLCLWSGLVVCESIDAILFKQKHNLQLYEKLSELRNKIIEQVNDKNARLPILDYKNPIIVVINGLHRVINEAFEDYPAKREAVDAIFAIETRRHEFEVNRTTWHSLLIDVANYLDVERGKVLLKENLKKQIIEQDKEIQDA